MQKPEFIISKGIKKILDTNENSLSYLNQNKSLFIIDFLKLNSKYIDWCCLSSNPNAIYILKNNLDKISWGYISNNENAISIIENNLDKINSTSLWSNENAFNICKKNIKDISLDMLCYNKNSEAIDFIGENINKLTFQRWQYLATNPNPKVMDIFKNYLTKIINFDYCNSVIHILLSNPNVNLIIDMFEPHIYRFGYQNNCSWKIICKNPSLINFIEKYPDKIDINALCYNINAIHIIEKNVDKLNIEDWNILFSNENAFKLIINNIDKIDLSSVSWLNIASTKHYREFIDILNSKNVKKLKSCSIPNDYFMKIDFIHNFIKLDYEKMKKNNSSFLEELVSKVFHPNRLLKLCDKYNMTFDEINDCY